MRRSSLIGAVAAAMLAGTTIAQAGGGYVVLSHPEVVDGRTFEDDFGNIYRLHGLDAPELGQQCLGGAGEVYDCGAASRDALARLVDGIITCDILDDEADVAQVRCQDFLDLDIGARLITAGWALPDRSVSQAYVFNEMEAEGREQGLWQGRFIEPKRWREGARL